METNTIQTLEKPVAAMVVGSDPWLGSVMERIAHGLALAYYRGQFEMRSSDPKWVERHADDARFKDVGQFAELRARENAAYFRDHWMDDAKEILLPNAEARNAATKT